MKNKLCLFSLFLLCFQSCGQHKSIGDSPSNLKIEHPHGLNKVYKTAQKTDNIRSLLVNYQDELVCEEYFDSYPSDSLDHIRSITKSVMATLIGIAIDKGFIGGVEESITKYLGELAKGKEAIKIKHLLTMTSGIEWNEQGGKGYNEWVTSPNELQYVLNKSMAHQPGEVWNYNSGGIHLLSVILTKATGMNTLKFAKKHLFTLIGIDKFKWERHADGFYNGGAGLQLRPKGMIKFGQLYLNGGNWNGKRILSATFIQEATHPQQFKNTPIVEDEGYGYCWFLVKYKGINGILATGYGGQLIGILPELNLVFSTTHNWRVNSKKAKQQGKMASTTLSKLLIEEFLKN